MRNLKKILALALVFAMAFTFTASATVGFIDKDEINPKYADAVGMLVQLGIISGYPDNSFQPQGNITRAEVAKLVYIINYGSDTNGDLFAAQTSQFYDVQNNGNVQWAKGYINYCANQKIVSGKGNGKYDPQGNVTVAELTKMLLVSLGCDPIKEGFTGANWMQNVTAKAISLGLYNGWVGDPSQLATREVACQLFKNAIFSSIYTYSAITGAGSQMDALGQHWNMTLGEKTMGLQTVTGIVVANERYYISTDEEGENIGIKIEETGVDSEESVILYEAANTESYEYYYDTITIDRALDDDMLGAKVNVYFKADRIENNGRIDFKNIEVIGDVVLDADTVIYTVPAFGIDVYPNGKSVSASEIRPYISFMDGDEEVKITMSNDVDRYAKSVDVKDTQDRTNAKANADVNKELAKYAYELKGANFDDDGELVKASNFVDGMGDATLDQYRFVSVDGGSNFCYMFKMVDQNQNADYAAVTAYSEAAGTIKIQGTTASGTFELEDVVALGDYTPATDDLVVAYRANGKIYIEPVESLVAAVDSFTDDDEDGIVLSGSAYYKWTDCDLDSYNNFFDYFQNNKGAMNGGAKFYLYNGLVLEIDAEDVEISTDSNYAVILRSYYDADLDTAYVKLGFADNSEGTYAISKFYTKKASDRQSPLNDRASDFDLNAYFGMVVNYKILDDQTLDLSGQYFKDDEALRYYVDGTNTVGYYDNATGAYVKDDTNTKMDSIEIYGGKIKFSRTFSKSVADFGDIGAAVSSTNYYPVNDNVIVFALYGTPSYKVDPDTNEIYVDPAQRGYLPVKSRAYKISELKDAGAKEISSICINVGGDASVTNAKVGHVLLNSKTASNKYAVAASLTVGPNTAGITYKDSNSLAYVVAAKQYYNALSGLYFAGVTLINEDGTMNLETVEDVKDLNNNSVLTADIVGPIDGKLGALPAGSFVRFKLNAEGKISAIDLDGGDWTKDQIKTKFDGKDGLYLANITGQRGNIISFYDTNASGKLADLPANSIEIHEKDGCRFIGISEDEYTGTGLTKLPTRTTDVVAGEGNAIIQVEEGQAVRVFSFADGYTLGK